MALDEIYKTAEFVKMNRFEVESMNDYSVANSP